MPFHRRIDRKKGLLGFSIVVPEDTEKSLNSSCFRGQSYRLAGNFHRWGSLQRLMGDKLIFSNLVEDIAELVDQRKVGAWSVDIEHDLTVGWSSTAPAGRYLTKDTHFFRPNKNSSGYQVNLNRVDLPAPETKYVTFAYDLKEDGRGVTATIRLIYPGEDIGPRVGDITTREGVVFFDKNHPGSFKRVQAPARARA